MGATVAPASLTESVMHNKLVAAGMLGSHYFGLEAFHVPTTTALMTALLIWDLQAPAGESLAHPATPARNPLELLCRTRAMVGHGPRHSRQTPLQSRQQCCTSWISTNILWVLALQLLQQCLVGERG